PESVSLAEIPELASLVSQAALRRLLVYHHPNPYNKTRQRGRIAWQRPMARIQPTEVQVATRFSTIEDAVEAIRHGKVVIVVDAEDRENEGDFVCAAEKSTPTTVNFMITHGRGQLCMPILPEVSQRLALHP